MKTCAVIYNPKSGKKVNFRVMPQFEKILADHGYESKIIYKEAFDRCLDFTDILNQEEKINKVIRDIISAIG